MNLYCSECGLKLVVTRKALPAYAKVIDVVAPHICSDRPAEIDFGPTSRAIPQPGGQFSDKLSSFSPKAEGSAITDRRPTENLRADLSTSAPQGVIDNIRASIEHGVSTPAHELIDPEGE